MGELRKLSVVIVGGDHQSIDAVSTGACVACEFQGFTIFPIGQSAASCSRML